MPIYYFMHIGRVRDRRNAASAFLGCSLFWGNKESETLYEPYRISLINNLCY